MSATYTSLASYSSDREEGVSYQHIYDLLFQRLRLLTPKVLNFEGPILRKVTCARCVEGFYSSKSPLLRTCLDETLTK